jgi:hypothetical protein
VRLLRGPALSLTCNVVGPRAQPEDTRDGGDNGREKKGRPDPWSDEQRSQADDPEEDGEEDPYTHRFPFSRRERPQTERATLRGYAAPPSP